jgi:hypothetical protein
VCSLSPDMLGRVPTPCQAYTRPPINQHGCLRKVARYYHTTCLTAAMPAPCAAWPLPYALPCSKKLLCASQVNLPTWAADPVPYAMPDKAKRLRTQAGHAAAACKIQDPSMVRGSAMSSVSSEEAPCHNGKAVVVGRYFTSLRCCPMPSEPVRQCFAEMIRQRAIKASLAGGR